LIAKLPVISMDLSCYRAYLLRAWLERPASSDQEAIWRFSLEEVPGETRRGFPSLEALTDYLKMQLSSLQNTGDLQ